MTITSFTSETLQPCGELRKISHENSNVAGKFMAQIPISVYHQTTQRNEVYKNEEWPLCICLVRKWRTNGLNLTATHKPSGSWKIAQCFWNSYKCRKTKNIADLTTANDNPTHVACFVIGATRQLHWENNIRAILFYNTRSPRRIKVLSLHEPRTAMFPMSCKLKKYESHVIRKQ